MRRKLKSQQPKKQPTKPNNQAPSEQTFLEHIHELRKRIFWVVLVLVVAAAAGLEYKDQLIAVVMAPLHGQKLIYLTPGGGFSFIFTLSMYFGALFTIPVAVYQLYRFLQPIIGKTSRKFLFGFILVSTLLAIGGALFGYYVTIPAALNFLSNFAGDSVIPSLTAESYLNFVVTYILGLAALFQLPLILFLIDHVRPMPPGTLSKTQNFVIIGATVLAAVITPTPDAFNMAIVAIPIIAIYEIGVLIIYLRGRMRRAPVVAAEPVIAIEPVGTPVVDEPLTSIVEEMLAEPVIEEAVTMEPTPELIPEIVPDQIVEAEPLVETTEQPTPEVVAQPAATAPVAPRAIDGFTRKPATQVYIPTRQERAAARFAAQQRSMPRQGRSIDGLSFV